MEDSEELWVKTFTLDEAVAVMKMDYWCDPEAALAHWVYAADVASGFVRIK